MSDPYSAVIQIRNDQIRGLEARVKELEEEVELQAARAHDNYEEYERVQELHADMHVRATQAEARVKELEELYDEAVRNLKTSLDNGYAWREDRERLRSVRDQMFVKNALQRFQSKRLRKFRDSIAQAHDEHLRTGDYKALGMAAQDALRALEGREQ